MPCLDLREVYANPAFTMLDVSARFRRFEHINMLGAVLRGFRVCGDGHHISISEIFSYELDAATRLVELQPATGYHLRVREHWCLRLVCLC
jgi:hypothetical protein